MSIVQLKGRLSELNFHGMIPKLQYVIDQNQKGEMHLIEALDLLIEEEWRHRSQKATETRKYRSKIRRGASLEEFDLSDPRGITKAELKQLAKFEWFHQGKPLILVGATGAGKTFLARALGLQLCEMGKTSLFLTITDFLEHQALARSSNTYLKFRDKLVKPDLLILDDFGMRKFTSQEAEDLRDVIDQRSYGKSTLITTQLTTDRWGEVIGDAIILDALIDRLEPPGQVIKLTGPTYREKLKMKIEKNTKSE